MTKFDLDNLENVARSATQGKWNSLDGPPADLLERNISVSYGCANAYAPYLDGVCILPYSMADANYIVTFNPPMILSMIEYIRSLEDRLEESSKL